MNRNSRRICIVLSETSSTDSNPRSFSLLTWEFTALQVWCSQDPQAIGCHHWWYESGCQAACQTFAPLVQALSGTRWSHPVSERNLAEVGLVTACVLAGFFCCSEVCFFVGTQCEQSCGSCTLFSFEWEKDMKRMHFNLENTGK